MGTEITTKETMLKEVSGNLDALLKHHARAMPQGFNETRFLQNCMTVLKDTKEIEKCTPVSVARTMLKGAFLGLDFFTKECYAICYGGNLQFQTDYKGERKLAYRHGVRKIKEIYAKLVRENDDFSVSIEDGTQKINFIPVPFSNTEIKGCFAVVNYEDGSMEYITMSKEEIEKTRRNFSKAPESKAWKFTPGEMYKKTTMRRLLKSVDLAFDNQEQIKAFEDGGDCDVKKPEEVIDITIENPYEEQIEVKELPAPEEKKEDFFKKNPSDVKCDENGKVIE